MYRLIIKIINNFLKKFKFFRLINYKLKKKYYINFENLNLEQNSIVLDFGANIGVVSQYLLDKYNCKIECYEPNKLLFKKLEKIFKYEKNVNCHNCGVAENNGSQKLYFHKNYNLDKINFSKGSSFIKEKNNIDINNYEYVETRSITDILNLYKKIDLIKIDIEGSEYSILPEIIKNKNKIKKVICELHGNNKKNKNFDEQYNNFIKLLNKTDPERKWFLKHH